jgi:hypothetical protein
MVLVRHKLELVLRMMVHMELVHHMLVLELRTMEQVLHIRKELRNRRMMASCFAVCPSAFAEGHRCRCHIRYRNRHSSP